MDTLTEPMTSVRLADSGGIKLLAKGPSKKPSEVRDEKSEVRLPLGPYRIVMQCRSVASTMKEDETLSNR